jgi:parallel beta helix pectate lyase-like protein/uncharacterized protein DUF11
MEIKGKCSYFVLTVVLLSVFNRITFAKSIYAITKHARPSIVNAYLIDNTEVVCQGKVDESCFGYGPIDITCSFNWDMLFLTYEAAPEVVVISAKTLEKVKDVNTGVQNLAGIIADDVREKIYIVKRDSKELYAYSWDEENKTLILEEPNDSEYPYYHLKDEGGNDISGWGLAIDAEDGLLYVSTDTKTVYYYDTDNFEYQGSIDTYSDRNEVGIAFDSDNDYLYTGGYSLGSGGSHNYLVRTYPANQNDPNENMEINVGARVIGLAVSDTGLLYTTNSDNKIRVYNPLSWSSDPNSLQPTDVESDSDISGPAGIAVGPLYKPPTLEIIKYDPNECLTLFDPNNFTEYTIRVNTLTLDANDVIVTDYLPPEVIFDYADPDTAVYDPDTHTVTWHLGDLPANSLAQYLYIGVYITSCAKPGIITNYVEVESDEFYNWTDWDTPICCWGGPVIYVDENAPGCNSGSSWYDAFTDLQDALQLIRDCPNNGSEIWVAKGTYIPGTDADDTYELIDGIDLYGGFAGNETNKDQRNWNTHRTILSGNNETENCYDVVMANGVNQNTIFDGFVVEAADENGVYCLNAAPTIANCLIQANGVAGIYCDVSDPNIIDCTVCHNWGDGIYCAESDPFISHCSIEGNLKNGVFCDNSEPDITQSVIKKNDHDGLFAEINSSPLLYECIVEANGSDGIECQGNDSDLIVSHCKIRANAEHGVYIYQADGNITNNWIHHNQQNGIQLYNCSSAADIRNNTIVYNAENGIERYSGTASPTVINNIIWGNNTQLSGSISPTYCCIQGVTVPNDDYNINNDPEFAYSDPEFYNFHLDPNSPCIDAGDDTDVESGETDIDGDYRITIIDPNVDIGADEVDCDDVSNDADFNGDGIVNLLDYTPLAAWWLTDDYEEQDPNWPDEYDLIGDGEINLLDLHVFCNHWLWQACYFSDDWYAMDMAMSPHSNSSGFGFGQYSAMQSQSTTTTATMPPPVEITVELVLEVIDQLQELWENNEKFRQVVTDEAWKESMEFLYQELERLSSQSQEKE